VDKNLHKYLKEFLTEMLPVGITSVAIKDLLSLPLNLEPTKPVNWGEMYTQENAFLLSSFVSHIVLLAKHNVETGACIQKTKFKYTYL